MSFEKISIEGKNIYIVQEHHHVLEAWAEYRKKVTSAPMMITLDHHTDTHRAFLQYSSNLRTLGYEDKKAKKLVSLIDYKVDETVINAIEKLRNDEHIDAAIKSGIISKAFVISYDASFDNPKVYEESFSVQHHHESKIYTIGNICYVGCEKNRHNDDCIISHFNQAIESIFLDDKLKTIYKMCPDCIKGNLFDKEYILDIDLDYFHTCKSINPKDIKTFHKLIRNSKIITIALEPCFVEEWKKYDKDIDCKSLKENLLEHIKNALS